MSVCPTLAGVGEGARPGVAFFDGEVGGGAAGAATHSAQVFDQAKDLLKRAQMELELGDYGRARKNALSAKEKALQARQEAIAAQQP